MTVVDGGSDILIVARDSSVVDVVETPLRLAGHQVRVVRTGLEALRRVENGTADLVILDTRLRDLTGVPRGRVRGRARVPVLLLTEGTTLDSLLPQLEPPWRDYVCHPVRVADLLTRTTLMLREASAAESGRTITLGDLRLDDDAYQAWRAERPLGLTPAEFRLLRGLVDAAGKVLSKEQIAQLVWGEHRDDNTIERLVSRLRSKVDDDAPALLRTHRGFGYSCTGHTRAV